MVTLASSSILVIDCQTTGATPDEGSIVELGFAVVRPDGPTEIESTEIESHLVALPEGQSLPAITQRLTGIRPTDMARAIAPEAALRRLLEVSRTLEPPGPAVRAALPGEDRRPRPAVIHFARFELPFLNELNFRFRSDESFFLEVTCTHEVAQRLHPELPRRGLRALAGFYGHPLGLSRRSAEHVSATISVWRGLIKELSVVGVETWADLKAMLREPRGKTRRAYPMPKSIRLDLPDRPGVYRLARLGGSVLYVGKATSLRARVNAHFRRQSGQSERTLEMLSQARNVDFVETESALEAALLESDEIKRLLPPYNVALVERDRGIWYSSADLWSWSRDPSSEFRVGPLPAPTSVRAIAAVRILLTGHEVSVTLAAAALGVRQAMGPSVDVFSRGFEAFRRRSLPTRNLSSILRLAASIELEEAEAATEESEQGSPFDWTEDKVEAALDRSLSQAARMLRRSRLLLRLAESTVVFTDVRSRSAPRMLCVEGGRVTQAVPRSELVRPPGAERPLRERRVLFDLATYDRMRVLLTELRSIAALGGEVLLGPTVPQAVLSHGGERFLPKPLSQIRAPIAYHAPGGRVP